MRKTRMLSVQELLKTHRLRDTAPRRLVLDTLLKSTEPLSAYDLQKLAAKAGKKINAVTVYRVLDVLDELHIVHREPVSGAYFLCSLPTEKGHHGFLRCTDCGSIEEFVNHDLCKIENAIAKRSGFAVSSHVSEIAGSCRDCAPRKS